ncbi:hypothetical protein A2U01_0104422, partial [Trifolium medium]|nr:hypothetical protein [Trifolium medium]
MKRFGDLRDMRFGGKGTRKSTTQTTMNVWDEGRCEKGSGAGRSVEGGKAVSFPEGGEAERSRVL